MPNLLDAMLGSLRAGYGFNRQSPAMRAVFSGSGGFIDPSSGHTVFVHGAGPRGGGGLGEAERLAGRISGKTEDLLLGYRAFGNMSAQLRQHILADQLVNFQGRDFERKLLDAQQPAIRAAAQRAERAIGQPTPPDPRSGVRRGVNTAGGGRIERQFGPGVGVPEAGEREQALSVAFEQFGAPRLSAQQTSILDDYRKNQAARGLRGGAVTGGVDDLRERFLSGNRSAALSFITNEMGTRFGESQAAGGLTGAKLEQALNQVLDQATAFQIQSAADRPLPGQSGVDAAVDAARGGTDPRTIGDRTGLDAFRRFFQDSDFAVEQFGLRNRVSNLGRGGLFGGGRPDTGDYRSARNVQSRAQNPYATETEFLDRLAFEQQQLGRGGGTLESIQTIGALQSAVGELAKLRSSLFSPVLY